MHQKKFDSLFLLDSVCSIKCIQITGYHSHREKKFTGLPVIIILLKKFAAEKHSELNERLL